MDEKELTLKSVEFAQDYINTQFKGKDLVEVHIAVNGVAHGFFMGVRRGQKIYSKKNFFVPKPPMAQHKLDNESNSAVKHYIKARQPHAADNVKVLLSTVVSYGFREGLRYSETLA